ncbi:NAD(P)-dependent oxidoreductase [Terrabacter sp. MAHUQ-38]|uniref:NAD(P)-dependent oxidoreductase n=1 Tax=unclassified Terrabacter TaxID=2630222 RepID=UPI00165D8383|nr:NAD(P)-dependent oxidoreductase [Terrabacter sp. MAHUQ-38]MBC9821623.1 NAD(P)-dependent oxidoreductase [Terrabacter sp. MAHUQ-38]
MTRVGFIGLGIMGRPMAANLLRAGLPLTVWNRSPEAARELGVAGARVAQSPAAVFAASDVVFLMLATADVVDDVLQRGRPAFAGMVSGRTLVPLGTTSPGYSVGLAHEVEAAGGSYVEAPVSGSRVPAERGELVGLVAGDREAVERVVPLLAPMCREVVRCGEVPAGIGTKLAVNLYLCATVAALAEAYHLAVALGLDLEAFQRALDSGPMASAVSTVKLTKLVARDFAPQAAIRDVHLNTRLIAEAARAVGASAPVIEASRQLFRETEAAGSGALDMAAVVTALERRDGVTPDRRAAPQQAHEAAGGHEASAR